MLFYPSAMGLSIATLWYVVKVIRGHLKRIGSRWRRVLPRDQALLVLAHLRNDDTYARLAAGFGIDVATAFRYIREATELLAAAAPTLTSALWQLAWSHNNYAILDGTVIRIDRIAANKPYCSGKHRYHDINLQGPTDPYGRLPWISDGPRRHQRLRRHAIPDTADILLLADAGYHHITEDVLTPYKGREHLPQHYLDANTERSRIRCRGERGFATLRNWVILHRAHRSTDRVATLAQAILTLERAG